MSDTLQAGKTRWSHYQIAYHFVWIPKYRRQILTGEVQVAAKTDEDHVHCFVSAPPKDSPAKIVGLLKGYSPRMLRQQFPALAKTTGKAQLWASAYYVGTAGTASAEVIKRYICECQGK